MDGLRMRDLGVLGKGRSGERHQEKRGENELLHGPNVARPSPDWKQFNRAELKRVTCRPIAEIACCSRPVLGGAHTSRSATPGYRLRTALGGVMMVVVMMVVVTPGGECGTGEHQSQQKTSEKLFHGTNLARSDRTHHLVWAISSAKPTCLPAPP